MPNLSSHDLLLTQNMWISSSTPQAPLGARAVTPDGRVFRYARAGAVAITAGQSVQAAAHFGAGHSALAGFTGGEAAGTFAVRITCVSSVAASLYNDGYLIVHTNAGGGYLYTIKSHPAVSTGAVGTFTLYDDDPIFTATTAAGTFSLYRNRYDGIIQTPITTATAEVVGVSTYTIAITQYGWIQTWGPCAALIDATGTMAIGATIYGVCTTAGEVGQPANVTTATCLLNQPIGVMVAAGLDKTFCLVHLRISP